MNFHNNQAAFSLMSAPRLYKTRSNCVDSRLRVAVVTETGDSFRVQRIWERPPLEVAANTLNENTSL
jgi:hypothetical protein